MGSSRAKTSDARDRLLQVARRRFAVDGALVPTLDEVRREAQVSVAAPVGTVKRMAMHSAMRWSSRQPAFTG